MLPAVRTAEVPGVPNARQTKVTVQVKLGPRSPAKLRELAIDTHDRLPVSVIANTRKAPYSPSIPSKRIQACGCELPLHAQACVVKHSWHLQQFIHLLMPLIAAYQERSCHIGAVRTRGATSA